MTMNQPARETSSSGAPLAEGRPLWQRLLSAGLIVKFLLVLMLVWFTHVRGCSKEIDPPVPVRAVDEIFRGPAQRIVFLCALAPMVAAVFLGVRRRHLLAATAFCLLRASGLLFFTSVFLAVILGEYPPGEVRIENGMWLGLAALAALLLLDAIRSARFLPPLVSHFRRSAPMRRRNFWLMPVTALDVGVGAFAFTTGLVFLCLTSPDWADNPVGPEWPVFIAAVFWGLALSLCLILAAWGLWERQTWAAWTHLYCGVPAVAAIVLYGIEEWPDVLTTVWYVPALLGIVTWWLYGFIAGYRLSAHWLQRGRCWRCGRIRWRRAARCDVCGERYWLFKDRAAAPACLACGHERQGAMPACRTCRAAKT